MNQTVLLVDDDENHAILSRILLERLDYDVVVCQDGAEAIEKFRLRPGDFSFVATDYTMEPMSGLELAVELREINPQVAVLMLTGYDYPDLYQKARAAGVRKVSLKPTTAGDFESVIQEMQL